VRVSRSKGSALGEKGASFLKELSWRVHLLERRRAHGMEMSVGLRLGAWYGDGCWLEVGHTSSKEGTPLHWAHRLEGEVYACELSYKLERGRNRD
jgi:hypothetical protein